VVSEIFDKGSDAEFRLRAFAITLINPSGDMPVAENVSTAVFGNSPFLKE